MMKWIVGLLLLANLAFFGWMRWGSALTVDAGAVPTALNPDKIRLLETLATPASGAASGTALTLSPVSAPAASAPVAMPVPVVAENAPPRTSNCAEWGEFSGDDLARSQQALAALNLGDKLTQRGVEQNHGFWVYIPPLKRRADVERKIAQLKERGVKDYFVVQERGKWLNAISLGVFKTKEAAQKYQAMLLAKDVRSARLGERMSKLKFTVFVMKGLDAETADKLNALQKGFPDSELKISACSN
jgi:hypothetical protein